MKEINSQHHRSNDCRFVKAGLGGIPYIAAAFSGRIMLGIGWLTFTLLLFGVFPAVLRAAPADSLPPPHARMRYCRTVSSPAFDWSDLSPAEDANPDIFSLHLFHTLLQEKNLRNQLIPTMLVALTLGLMSEGAKGETQNELVKVLRQTPQSVDDFNQVNLKILEEMLAGGSAHEVFVARSVWVDKAMKLSPEFQKKAEESYQTKVKRIAPGPEAYKEINSWFTESIGGKMPAVFKTSSPEDKLTTLDGLYFKGNWAMEFRSMGFLNFNLHDGGTLPHTMMYREGSFEYFEDEFLQAVRLPYHKSDLVLELYLPRQANGILNISRYIRPETWLKWQQSFAKKAGTVILPVFSFSSRVTLPEVLSKMGVKTAFHPQAADFSPMFEGGNARISNMVFASSFRTSTDGAAVPFSAKTIGGQGFHMLVDHPFFYVIRHRTLNRIVVMGTIIKPKD